VLVLCLDTATPDVAAAAVDTATGEVWAQTVRDPRGAGERLMPLAIAALAAAGVSLREVGAIAVGLGPGPYTGLRVGVVTAATLGLALGVPAFGACSLDVWADGSCLVATDARRREVFWAAYEGGVRVDGPHVDAPADVPAAARVVGPGAVLLGRATDERPCPVGRLASLVDLGADPPALVPTYLRRPDAALPLAKRA
jgi:tRNA threonylcarbamoyl adenosine modification protein YeaZ